MAATGKPGRPLGVTLAILASVFLFSLLPIARVVFLALVNRHVYIDPEGTGFVAGSNVLGITDAGLILQTVLGILFLVVAILAWRGRPSYIRYVMVLVILMLTAIAIAVNILPSLTAECTQLPCDSSLEVNLKLAYIQLLFTILIPVYVMWYMNRGPARAFYRGYYLKDPAETTDPETRAN